MTSRCPIAPRAKAVLAALLACLWLIVGGPASSRHVLVLAADPILSDPEPAPAKSSPTPSRHARPTRSRPVAKDDEPDEKPSDARPLRPPAPSPGPASSAKQRPKSIFDYRTELGLTDRQVRALHDAVETLRQYLADGKRRLTANNAQIQALQARGAKIADIRPFTDANAKIESEMRLVDMQTAQSINHILTPEQLAKWRQIQASARHKN